MSELIQPHWLTEDEMSELGERPSIVEGAEVCYAGRWYHTDETWCDLCGPFTSAAQAHTACANYAQTLHKGTDATNSNKA